MGWSSKLLLKVSACLLVINIFSAYGALPCQLREISADHLVCVCNATYCDTLDADVDVPSGEYVLYSTTKAGLRFAKSTGSLTNNTCAADLQFSIDASSTNVNQHVVGFGTAFTDAAGINLLSLSVSAQENLLRSYFSPDGIELSMGRVPIAGSDFSTRPYTYDDVEDDTDLSEFDLTFEDLEYKIPIIKRAMEISRKEFKLLAAAWSAPPWMKTNNDYTGIGSLKKEFYQLWADYHLKFLEAYGNHSLGFWAISTGNEPINGDIGIVKFNSLGWTPGNQATWVAENLGPTIKNSHFNQTKILALDDQRIMLPWWITIMMKNVEAGRFLDGIAVHWYLDQFIPAGLLTSTHEKFPDMFIISSEACRGDRPWDTSVVLGSWDRGEDYMSNIIEDLNHWVSGWVDWNFALNLQGGPNWADNTVDSAIIINKDADEFYKQPMYYALGHFSKFIPENSVHISVEPESGSGIYVTAVTTPNGQTVVVLNNRRRRGKIVTVKHSEKGSVCLSIPAYSFNTLLF